MYLKYGGHSIQYTRIFYVTGQLHSYTLLHWSEFTSSARSLQKIHSLRRKRLTIIRPIRIRHVTFPRVSISLRYIIRWSSYIRNKKLTSWNILFGWLIITKKYYYLNTTNIFYLLSFRPLSETFIRKSLFNSCCGYCHDSDATWQEIGRTCVCQGVAALVQVQGSSILEPGRGQLP